jgi:hypothetical protein
MGFKWDRDQQQWYGPLSLRSLESLDRWPEVEISPEARQAICAFQEAARRARAEGERGGS